MPFSLPRLLSKLQSVITIDTANNDLRIANAVVFSDGTRQTTAGVAVDAFARTTANGANGLAQGAYNQANVTVGIDATQNTRIQSIETINVNQNNSISIIQGINLTQNTNITDVNQFAQSAYDKANTAGGADTEVQFNSSGAFAGSSTFTYDGTKVTVPQLTINSNNIALGYNAGTGLYNNGIVAIGKNAGEFSQGDGTVAVGDRAGQNQQSITAVAIGAAAGQNYQSSGAVSIGTSAGGTSQGQSSVAIGEGAGNSSQGAAAVAVGRYSGLISQGINSVAIGYDAGGTNQGQYAVALGYGAGQSYQPSSSIIINASIVPLDGTNAGLYINPIRQNIDSNENIVCYDVNTKEITYTTNFAAANTIYLQGALNTANANISYILGVELTQNTRLDDIEGVNLTQNTNITAVNQFAQSAYDTANTNSNTITLVNQFAQSAYNQANTGAVLAQAAFDKANTGGSSAGLAGWSVINSNYAVGNNVQLIANTTTAGFTITLPATPVSGNTVVITDGSITSVGWSNNNVTVARNGSTILGYADDLVLNVSRSTATLVYDGGTWQVSSTVGPKGDTGTAGPAGANGAPGPAGTGANATQRTYHFTATNNQTIFVGGDVYGSSLSYNVNAVSVYLNGVFLRKTEDYFANNGTTIVLNTGSFANDALDVVAFESMSLTAAQNTIVTYVYTASNNQTSFGGADINGRTLNYNQNNLFVTLNGLTLISGVDYLQSNTSYIALTSGALANDEVSIVVFGSFSVQGQNTQNTISTYYYTSTAGQTNFTGSDIYGRTLSYMQDGLIVVRNGSTLRNRIDYSATNGTLVSLANPTAANDEIAITAFGNFSVAANGYTQVEANNLFLTKADANTIFASEVELQASIANTYTQAQANAQFASTGKAIAMAIVFGG